MVKKSLQSILILSLFAGAEVPAQSAGNTYLDFMPLITRGDRDRGTENPAYGARMVLGYGQQGPWYIEGQLFGVRADMDEFFEDSHFYTSGLGIDAVYAFSDRRYYTPFLLFGVGAAVDNPPFASSETNAFVNLGAGFVSNPLNRSGLQLRAELRYMRDYFSDDQFSSSNAMNDWQLGVGFSFPLCPPVAKAAYVPPPVQPAPQPPKDSDGDGVLDQHDRCPDSLPRVKVDSDGCAVAEQTITLENIQFEFNSATLTSQAKLSLNGVVQALSSQPGIRVEVAGHTDNLGKDSYNLRLSDKRANSVRQYLVDHGIAASRITAKGYGEQQPVASNATDAGRAQNRRVELRFQ